MSTKTATITLKLGWVGGGIYVAIGILYQLLTGDGPFSWGDPWLYASMFLWPFFLLGWLFVFMVVVVCAFGIFWYFFEELPKQRRHKAYIADVRANLQSHDAEMEERRRKIAKATPSHDED